MNIGEFKERIKDIPDDWEFTNSFYYVIDEEAGVMVIVHRPFVGVLVDQAENQIAFVSGEDLEATDKACHEVIPLTENFKISELDPLDEEDEDDNGD